MSGLVTTLALKFTPVAAHTDGVEKGKPVADHICNKFLKLYDLHNLALWFEPKTHALVQVGAMRNQYRGYLLANSNISKLARFYYGQPFSGARALPDVAIH